MEEKELKEALESIRAVKETLKRTSAYMDVLWQIFCGVGVSVFISYVIFQVLVWKNLRRLFGMPWVLLGILVVLSTVIPVASKIRSSGGKGRVEIAFHNFIGSFTLFALLVAAFVQILPQRINPVPVEKIYAVWIIAYAFILFAVGKYLSLKSFMLSGVLVLVGIPLAGAFPHYQYLISGVFLGLSLIIPSLTELVRGRG